MEQLESIRQGVLDLMAEADKLAATIRAKIRAHVDAQGTKK
jgi:hypothetical protein